MHAQRGWLPGLLLMGLMALSLGGCGGTAVATPTPDLLPTAPAVPEEAHEVAERFLAAWRRQAYDEMYALLSPAARTTFDLQTFTATYTEFDEAAGRQDCRTERYGDRMASGGVEMGIRVEMDSDLFDVLRLDNRLRMEATGGEWRVDWSPDAVAGGLSPGGSIVRLTTAAIRGTIHDVQGRVLAFSEPVVAVGAVPGEIDDVHVFADTVGPILERAPSEIVTALNAARPTWLTPLATVSLEEWDRRKAMLDGVPGLRFGESTLRRYPYGAVAAHSVGYVGEVTAEQLAQPAYSRRRVGDRIGQLGLEAWGEHALVGEANARLVILAPDGSLARTLARAELSGSRDLHSTLDIELQQAIEAALGDQPGAVVVLDPRNGAIRALASNPGFDPSLPARPSSDPERAHLLSDARAPLLNRATQAALPPGSLFKIVTTAAGLHSRLYTGESTYTCTGSWEALEPGQVRYDWLRSGHGTLTPAQALTVSCNPTFYDMGLRLHGHDAGALPAMARHFGFGAPTGLRGAGEAAGLIPDKDWKAAARSEIWWEADAVNMAIGQGDVLATPLQIAGMMAAVANGGAYPRPTLVSRLGEEMAPPDFAPAPPLTAEDWALLQAALANVTRAPSGTAARAFDGFAVAVAGKTGTAENPGPAPHAWFAAYAPVEAPEVVVVVLVEHGGEGSTVAAPIARAVLEALFQEPASP